MEAVQPLSTSLQQGLLATMLAVALIVIAYLFKDSRSRSDAHAAELKAINEARLKERDEQHTAHLATLTQTIPLANNLVAGIGTVEKVVDKLLAQKNGAAA